MLEKEKPRKRSIDAHKHTAILEAAVTLFLKHGYTKTSMDLIAKEAGVTKQTVYGHYQSKDGLFTQMVAELCRKHTPSTTLLHSQGESVEAVLYQFGLCFLNMITSKEGLAATRLVIAEATIHPALAKLYYETGSIPMLTAVATYLEHETNKGVLHIPSSMSAASYFFSMLKGNYYVRMLLNIKPLPTPDVKEQHIQETVQIFMHLYGGKNPLHTKSVL